MPQEQKIKTYIVFILGSTPSILLALETNFEHLGEISSTLFLTFSSLVITVFVIPLFILAFYVIVGLPLLILSAILQLLLGKWVFEKFDALFDQVSKIRWYNYNILLNMSLLLEIFIGGIMLYGKYGG